MDDKKALSIDEQRLKSIVERGGGQWLGVNTAPSQLRTPRENFVEFHHPLTHSTVSLPIIQVTEDNVKKKLIEHAKIWGIKAIRKILSSFIGNEVIPELDFLDTQKHIDLNNQSLVVKELINLGRKDVAEYIRTITPGSYALLVQHVKTSNKVEQVRISNTKEALQPCPYCGRSVTDEGCPNCGWSTMTEEELFKKDESSNILSEKGSEIPSREEVEELIDREKAMEEEQKNKRPKESISPESFRPATILGERDIKATWWEDRKFKHPETGNMVLFPSLPPEEHQVKKQIEEEETKGYYRQMTEPPPKTPGEELKKEKSEEPEPKKEKPKKEEPKKEEPKKEEPKKDEDLQFVVKNMENYDDYAEELQNLEGEVEDLELKSGIGELEEWEEDDLERTKAELESKLNEAEKKFSSIVGILMKLKDQISEKDRSKVETILSKVEESIKQRDFTQLHDLKDIVELFKEPKKEVPKAPEKEVSKAKTEENQLTEFLLNLGKIKPEDTKKYFHEPKDVKRIEDIVSRAGGDPKSEKALSLAKTMANKIDGAFKAWRRYNAATDNNYHDIAKVFYDRMKELVQMGKMAEVDKTILADRDVCAGTISDEELTQLYLSTREKSPLLATREFLQALTVKGLTAQDIAELLPRINMLKKMLDKNKVGMLSEEDLEKEKKIKRDLIPPPSYGFIPSLSELDVEKRADTFVPPTDFVSKLGRMGFTQEETARIYTHVSDYMLGRIPWEHFLKLINIPIGDYSGRQRRMNLSEYLSTLRLGKMSEKVEKKSDHPPKGWMIAEIMKRRDDPKIYSKYFSTFQSLYEDLIRLGATERENVDKSLDRLPYDRLMKWFKVFQKLSAKKGVKTIIVDNSDLNSDWIKKVKK